jgi:hypothetical protein
MEGVAVIHCRYCGTNNEVKRAVVGWLCESCGKDIYTPEFEEEMRNKPQTPVAIADRSGDVLRVTRPQCQHVNEFPGWNSIDISSAAVVASRLR